MFTPIVNSVLHRYDIIANTNRLVEDTLNEVLVFADLFLALLAKLCTQLSLGPFFQRQLEA